MGIKADLATFAAAELRAFVSAAAAACAASFALAVSSLAFSANALSLPCRVEVFTRGTGLPPTMTTLAEGLETEGLRREVLVAAVEAGEGTAGGAVLF